MIELSNTKVKEVNVNQGYKNVTQVAYIFYLVSLVFYWPYNQNYLDAIDYTLTHT